MGQPGHDGPSRRRPCRPRRARTGAATGGLRSGTVRLRRHIGFHRGPRAKPGPKQADRTRHRPESFRRIFRGLDSAGRCATVDHPRRFRHPVRRSCPGTASPGTRRRSFGRGACRRKADSLGGGSRTPIAWHDRRKSPVDPRTACGRGRSGGACGHRRRLCHLPARVLCAHYCRLGSVHFVSNGPGRFARLLGRVNAARAACRAGCGRDAGTHTVGPGIQSCRYRGGGERRRCSRSDGQGGGSVRG